MRYINCTLQWSSHETILTKTNISSRRMNLRVERASVGLLQRDDLRRASLTVLSAMIQLVWRPLLYTCRHHKHHARSSVRVDTPLEREVPYCAGSGGPDEDIWTAESAACPCPLWWSVWWRSLCRIVKVLIAVWTIKSSIVRPDSGIV